MGVSMNFNDNVGRNIERGADMGSKMAGNHLVGEAVERAPLETGALRASANMSASGDGEVTVAFNTPYAAKQHEEVGYAHTDGEAKYLENAMLAEQDTLRRIIAEQIRRAM